MTRTVVTTSACGNSSGGPFSSGAGRSPTPLAVGVVSVARVPSIERGCRVARRSGPGSHVFLAAAQDVCIVGERVDSRGARGGGCPSACQARVLEGGASGRGWSPEGRSQLCGLVAWAERRAPGYSTRREGTRTAVRGVWGVRMQLNTEYAMAIMLAPLWGMWSHQRKRGQDRL